MNFYPKIVTVSGESRNIGKTLFVCAIIKKLAVQTPIVALKISPHHHKNIGNAKLLESNTDFELYTEINTFINNDTSRYLTNGADKAYLLQTNDDGFMNGFNQFLSYCNNQTFIVCESQRINNFIQPAITFFIGKSRDTEFLQTKRVLVDPNAFDKMIHRIEIINNQWKLNAE